jgi:hypothetical protein
MIRQFLLVLGLAFGSSAPVLATEYELNCGGAQEGVQTVGPTDSVIVARVVFVGFYNQPSRQNEPTWADTLTTNLKNYIWAMSRGHQRFSLNVVRRLDDSTKVWIAKHTASVYGGAGGSLNTEIMQTIDSTYVAALSTNIWSGVEMVFMIHHNCAFTDCNVGGYGGLGLTGSINAFTGTGTTQHLNDGLPVNHAGNRTFAEQVAGHEYGHLLGFSHSPHTNTAESNYVNMGWYDIMRANTGYGASERGVVPYHVQWLVQAGWLSKTTLSSDVVGLRVKDVRGADGVVYEVTIPGSNQKYLFENHQQTNFDAKYDGAGLLIWHYLPSLAWDLECAGGKFTGGSPDPASGADDLESNRWNKGSAGDFYDGTPATFAGSTNPNACLYSSNSYSAAQTGASSFALENIHLDGSDILVDVFVDPKQYVSYPNGGEAIASGDSLVVTWDRRQYANIGQVDVALSTNGGSSFTTVASSQPNTGSFAFVPTSLSAQCRVRVTSYDSLTSAADASDGNFTLAVVSQSSLAYNGVQVQVDSFTVNVTWNTLVATQSGGDEVRFFRTQTGGTPISPSAVTYTTAQGGLAHTAACMMTPCDTNKWWYEVKSTNKGVTQWSARTGTTCFKVNACIEP